jgi:hypothetical protein
MRNCHYPGHRRQHLEFGTVVEEHDAIGGLKAQAIHVRADTQKLARPARAQRGQSQQRGREVNVLTPQWTK